MLLFSKGEKHISVEPFEVSHIEADDKSCHIYLVKDKQKFTENHCLLHYENKLSESGLFIKIGRSTLINRKEVDYFTRHMLYMKSGAEISLTESAYEELNELLD